MYFISIEDHGNVRYLVWDEYMLNYEDDGYAWVMDKEDVVNLLCNNIPDHPFAFINREDAEKFLQTFDCEMECKIVEMTV